MATHLFSLAAFGLGGGELIAILAVVLLLFGGTKLPQLAKGLGQSMKEFKKAAKEDDDEKPAEAKKPVEAGKSHGPN
jgi:sec-independent protein translocase protein TatA